MIEPAEIKKTSSGLVLSSRLGDLKIDFLNDHKNYLKPLNRGKHELIAKALGLPRGNNDIVDLTAGLAQDAVTFARLECRVRAIERSPLIFPLLEEAHQKALDQSLTWSHNIKFIFCEGQEYLDALKPEECPQVIYVDPMFPYEGKTALPRKEMQIFRAVIGEKNDGEVLVKKAFQKATDRVVVKRPLHAQDLVPGVSHRFKGSSIRYDMYLSTLI